MMEIELNISLLVAALVYALCIIRGYKLGIVGIAYGIASKIFGVLLIIYICMQVKNIVLSIIIGFVFFLIGWKVIMFIQNKTIIGMISKLIGAAWGFVEASVIIWMVMIVIGFINDTELYQRIMEDIEASNVLKFIYNNNILTNLKTFL